MKTEQAESRRLRKEVAELKMEGDIRKKSGAYFATESERTALKVFLTREQARAEVFDNILRLHNSIRRQSTLGYLSPIACEKARQA